MMIQLIIDGKNIIVKDNTTVLDAARQAGIDIPTLCHHTGITPPVSCLVCVVKVDGRDNFAPSCATIVREGMVVDTCSEEVSECRRRAIELLLSEHAGQCSQCGDKKSVCKLRIYAARYRARWTRYDKGERKDHSRKSYDSGLVHDPGNCIVCGKCVSITREKNIRPGLSFCGRGSNIRISAPFGEDLDKAMGDALVECVNACPTGALRHANNNQ